MRQIKFRIFFDNEMLPLNGHVKGNPFYLAPTAGAPCIVFYHDKTYEPHFIGEAAINLNRDYILIEQNEKYFDIITKRIENVMQQKTKQLNLWKNLT